MSQIFFAGKKRNSKRRVRFARVSAPTLPFITRLWFAWACFFRVLFDGAFALRAFEAQNPPPPKTIEQAPELPKAERPKKAKPIEKPPEAKPGVSRETAALQLLSLLQREGRLVDFLEQDIDSFSDADIGAAVRVVHQGCRKALRNHMKLQPIRSEAEESALTLEKGFDAHSIKLTGNIKGSAPYKGVLRHRGWKANDIVLPTPVEGHDPSVIAPAEVEL